MSTCGKCRYWADFGTHPDQRECQKIDFYERAGVLDSGSAAIEVTVHDDSGLQHRLLTHAAFGCTMFKSQ